MISFACPGCSAVFSTSDDKAGKTGKCPKCSAQFVIPDAPAKADPGPAASAPASAEPDTVEIKPCPGCQSKLTVAVTDLGLDVECPYCKQVYKATKVGGTSISKRSDEVRSESSRRDRDDEDDDDDDRPKRKKRRYEDDDDDDDYDDRPRKRSRSRGRGRGAPHRGVLILIMGILSLFFCGIILGPIAWVMGNNDLREMDAGRMDSEGRGQTQAGRIIGMIATILNALLILFYCVIFAIGFAGAAANPRGGPQGFPNRVGR
ncbi:MAG: hypothetical protein U0798_13660 [Gemmataceae bacterium]